MKRISIFILFLFMAFTPLFALEQGENAFDRGVGKMNSVFIPKGYVGGSLSFSYKTYDMGNASNDPGYSMLFSLLSGLKGDMHTVGIAPAVSYFIMDNFSVGARFSYNRTSLDVEQLGMSVGDLVSFNINDVNFLKNMYSFAGAGRYYMPIAQSKRIAMFGELRVGVDLGQSVSYRTIDGRNQGTFQNIAGFSIDVVPGLCVFATNEVCVEVAVGILGFNYQHIKQNTNLVETSKMSQSGANFKINPLSISLGVSFYLPAPKFQFLKRSK